ncbi:nucleotidyl transferase AbiEii/AbiGii toxin family protein [Pseudoalteromonas shioyasakiensis]|jgi:predicted nucleotidyltransferase component of viral defense system|uniref:Nucleotidyl transferase AbiEii/AbiGii toxin family protein n=1 Tax=Pseudoalteromonas shioyasakiensis TaxID=1190813 RepID=A0ABT6U3Q6_9GAMM|nr:MULTISPECIES: nucleotidyl transferase AbiEii/AbiGii toxin family protein [Pseudoalteromonas]MDI4670777.1 nucleotidyl transferase AbiEii/AbiGii toxin family protein [Pseudoalteromonas shioyasakiensis]MDI4671784.1 nucleotidyl transferase AbiEii/AbiGii toxin family protein [Pseudoalteromonas shioyasakiensis]MDI4687691.1 nucleotidyl transferase AbiEii/AbiGii toxin family protein [Pseudoalteromonas shioyasakiensis]MDI4706282.1 nucleotidyl transferase AbiEii/AbiGii toxin family protein [Pseudoalte
MKTEQENFAQLVNLAMQTTNVSHMRAVIEKELLHYDILFALERGGFLDKLVFQGGTSLRLCYGGNRFSEDLDFAGGKEFNSFMLKDIKACIEKYIGERYGLEVTVKEPKELKKDPKYSELKIDKWQVAVVTAPQRKDLPKQKIKLEVANIPAYTKQPLPLNVNYDFLPDGYSDTLILAESLDEVMADKIISLPATTKYVRHRDIWDLAWLQQQGAQLDIELVKNKVADYQLEQYQSMLSHLIDRLPELITSPEFIGEMKRFLDTEVFDRTLGKEKFQLYLQNTLTELFKTVLSKMFTEATELEFKM